jgi:uncharacterized protein YukE
VLYGYVPKINSVSSALDQQVSRLVGAAGWKGAAASTFTAEWDRDAVAATVMASAANNIGGIVDQLAVQLSKVESELEDAAADARSHGVPVGTNGTPPAPVTPAQAHAGTTSSGSQWASAYSEFYQECMAAAARARDEAAAAIAKATTPAKAKTKTPATPVQGITLADGITLGDLAGDMLALPAANQQIVRDRILKAQADEKQAEGDEDEALKEAESGEESVDDLINRLAADDDRLAKDDAKLSHDQAELKEDQELDTEVNKLLSTSIGDLTANVNALIARLAGAVHGAVSTGKSGDGDGGAAADGADDGSGSLLSKIVDVGSDIPVIDVAAALAGTGLSTYSDVRAGQSVTTALPEELTANVAGVAAGAVVGGAAMTLVGGGIVGGAVAALSAGAVAYGVGSLTDNLVHQDWGGDIHSHGVVDGIGVGTLDSVKETGDDFTGLGKDVSHTASSIWHSVF